MLQMGVVGVGIGGGHGATIHKDGTAKLAAVCDRDPARLTWRVETYAKEMGLHVRGYTDLDEMLTKEKLDGVVISTPSGVHHQQAIIAAKHRVNMLIDKPIDISAEHIDLIQDAVGRSGVLCGVNYGMRFTRGLWAVKKALDAGEFGTLLELDVRLKFHRDQAYYDKGGWRGTWAMDGGGSLMNQGAHVMDVVTWLAGKPRKVRGDFAAMTHKIETEDWASGIVEFESGARATITTTTNVFPKIDRVWVDIHGTKGSAYVVGTDVVDTNIESLKQPAEPPYPNAVIDFVHAVKDGRSPLCDMAQGRWSVQLILAVYESARQNKTITVA